MADYIPLISQAKSLVQAIRGDTEGARKTQDNFTTTFILISQVRALTHLALGDIDTAKDTFKAGACFFDGVPVVGHVKGVVHYVCGDKEGGDAAMIAASRTTGVIAGSVGGFLVGGPVGAAAGGVCGGILLDEVTSDAHLLIYGQYRRHARYRAAEAVIKNPTDPWLYLDFAVGPAMDAMVGFNVGRSLARNGSVATLPERERIVYQVARKPKQVYEIVKEACETEWRANTYNEEAVVPVRKVVYTDEYTGIN